MLMKASVDFDTSELERKTKKIMDDVDRKIDIIMDYNAVWGTAWMKINAPWTDDTSAARTSLIAIAARSGSSREITVAHGVNYGIWLEVANSGRFQILAPAIRAISRNVLKSFEGLLNDSPPRIGAPIKEIPPQPRKPTNRHRRGNRKGRPGNRRRRLT